MMKKTAVVAVISAALIAGLMGCGSAPKETQVAASPSVSSASVPQAPIVPQASPARRYLDHAEPAEMPEWVPHVPQSETELYFVGASQGYSAIADVRENARADARNQVLKYYGQFLQARVIETTSFTSRADEAFISLVDGEEEIISFAQAIVSQVTADNYYTEFYKVVDDKGDARDEYIIYVLCEVSREKVTRDIDNYARNISEPYAALLRSPQDSLAAQMGMYEHIIAALINNPLYRSTAYYDSSTGRTNLYDYVMVQLINAARSVSFDPLPTQSVEKGESLAVVVQARSSLAQKIGGLNCSLNIYGKNNPVPPHNALVDADNTIRFEIRTGQLELGSYNVSLELFLHEAAVHVAKEQNPMMGFSFTVAPVNATIRFTGDTIDETGKESLTQSLQQGIQQYGTPIVLNTIAHLNCPELVVTLRKTEYPETGLIGYYVTLAFARNGQPLVNMESREFKDTSIDLLFRKFIAGFISNNRQFFQDVNSRLERN
jgi:hypothetical protein